MRNAKTVNGVSPFSIVFMVFRVTPTSAASSSCVMFFIARWTRMVFVSSLPILYLLLYIRSEIRKVITPAESISHPISSLPKSTICDSHVRSRVEAAP